RRCVGELCLKHNLLIHKAPAQTTTTMATETMRVQHQQHDPTHSNPTTASWCQQRVMMAHHRGEQHITREQAVDILRPRTIH
ncbi:hypothetical protein PAXRUDRAFT_152401, partial [Paxillus rubicundulus Ve08.2h10]